MGRKTNGVDRARQVLAQEAARIIVEQGIEDFRAAKIKAAERLGMSEHGSLPGNTEIQQAVSDHLELFGRDSYADMLRALRRTALSAMQLMAPYTPRLVGPVLHGTAVVSAAINLHVFADHSELIATMLEQSSLSYRPYERRLKSRRDRAESFAGFRFAYDDSYVEATVFPINGMRQAPLSPIDGKPMQRADFRTVEEMIDGKV
jgi:hypothetical protein